MRNVGKKETKAKKKKKNLGGKIQTTFDARKTLFPSHPPRESSPTFYSPLLPSERASEPANKTEHAVFSSACLKRKEKPFPRREDDFLSRPMEQTFFSIPFHLTVYSIVRTDTAFSTSVSSKTTLSRTGYSRTWRDRGLECGRRKRNKMESVR